MTRRHFDGTKLENDIAHLRAVDATSPPAARPSLMDAVRAFAEFIDTRAKLGWTDAMIAAVLTEAGYPINAATLRSYRKRMRDKGSARHTSDRVETPTAAVTPLRRGDQSGAADTAQTSVITNSSAKMPETIRSGDSDARSVTAAARAPPKGASPIRRTFPVNPSKRPPDQA